MFSSLREPAPCGLAPTGLAPAEPNPGDVRRAGGRRRLRLHAAFACGLLLAGLATALNLAAQGPGPAAAQADEAAVFRSGTELVDLHVSVLDKSGKLITDIPKDAFKVYENGVEQPVKMFRREDVPVSMGIIIDSSGSMRDKRTSVGAAALELVRASNPQDEVFIVDFNDDPYLDQTFTNDVHKLEGALSKIDSRGGTSMRDAISLAIDYERDKATRDKKVLLVVTDGNDNASNISLERLIRKAQRSGVLIYCIGLLNEEDPHEAREAKHALKALTEASGGMDYYPKDLAQVRTITPQVAHEIRNQYLLAYSPTNPNLDGTYREIKVTVSGVSHPNVRTRSGYYATAQPAKAPSSLSN
jgi:Ca-activated chloride channel family protein